MVTLKTDTGGILAATDHAMMNWIGFPYNVILSSSVNIEVNINELSINDDIFGILAGRLYKITNESFTFPLPTSGTQAGVLYLKLDLNNVDNPLQLLASTGASVADLVQEQNADSDISNFDKSKVVVKWLCSFTLTTSAITNVTVLIPYGDDADYITALGNRMNAVETTVSQIADEYDPSVSYAVGDYCTYNGTIYRCTAATTGAFDPSTWTDSVIVMNAVKSLKGRMTTAEGDITALNQSLAQSYTVKTVTNAYCTMVNRYVVIGKLVIGQVDVTPHQAINNSAGDFADMTGAPPALTTTCTVHLFSNTEQKTQYIVMRPNRTWSAYGPYTANQTVSGVYCYMTS